MAVASTTELEAVNIMLRSIGEAPVATIEVDTIEDATIALDTLRQISKDFQAEGWSFNTEYDYPVSVDGNSKLPYPTSASHLDAMPTEDKQLAKRGGFLYDIKNNTFVMTVTSVKCMVVWMYDFDDLPQLAKSYIALSAARKFAQDVMGDQNTVSYTAQDEARARAMFVGDDLRVRDLNMLSDSTTVNRAVRRRSAWPV